MDWSRFVEKECHTCHRKFMSPSGSTTQFCPNCGGLPNIYTENWGHEE